eukprot:767675-Hanusia_phi.AAC.2
MKCADSPLSTVCWREERILLVLELAVEGFTRRVKGLLTRCCPLSLRRREYDPATVAEKEAEKSPPGCSSQIVSGEEEEGGQVEAGERWWWMNGMNRARRAEEGRRKGNQGKRRKGDDGRDGTCFIPDHSRDQGGRLPGC